MHHLIIRYFNGTITPEEKNALFSKIETDAAFRKYFISVQNIKGLTSWFPSETDEAVAIGKLLEFKQSQKKKKPAYSFRNLIGYAAAVSIAVIVTWATMNILSNREDPSLQAYEEFSVPAGQRAMIKLYDGTTVWLNARSTLRYPHQFSKKERRVELDGEGFFDVKKDSKKPFVVYTEKQNITVLGTKFNVFAYKGRNEFKTSLVEGSVKIYNNEGGNILFLEPNETAELIDNKLTKTCTINSDFLLWKDGIYAFDDVTFSDIIKKLELYYDTTITVKNARVKAYKFSGKFRQRDGVESVLRTMQKVHHFSFFKDDELNVITIQ